MLIWEIWVLLKKLFLSTTMILIVIIGTGVWNISMDIKSICDYDDY